MAAAKEKEAAAAAAAGGGGGGPRVAVPAFGPLQPCVEDPNSNTVVARAVAEAAGAVALDAPGGGAATAVRSPAPPRCPTQYRAIGISG